MERGDGGLPAWGFWEPEAGGGAYVTAETGAASLSSFGGPSIAIASPSCAAFGGCSVVSSGEPCSYGKQQQQVLTCLKLGKRQYYDGGRDGEEATAGTKRAATATMTRGAAMPRCQVEGCSKALVDAKDYHKRHKVCEMHSKAPCVVVLGAQQRFCQQCSRFHVISEFDDAKRSCRRRLAGHNERRRKSSSSEPIMRNHPSLESTIMSSRYPYTSSNSPGRALSLLSSKATSWVSTPEVSSRSSTALRELIAENRAALFAKQLFFDRSLQSLAQTSCSSVCCDPHQHQLPFQIPGQLSNNGWNHLHGSGNHVTLDLMQMPTSSVEFLPVRNKSKDEEEECCEIWKSLEGTHVL